MTEHKIIQPLEPHDGEEPLAKAEVETRSAATGTYFTMEPLKKMEARQAEQSQIVIRHYIDQNSKYRSRWVLVTLVAAFLLLLSSLPITGLLLMIMRPFILLAWGLYGLYASYHSIVANLMLSRYGQDRRAAYCLVGLMIVVSIGLLILGSRALSPQVFWRSQGLGL